MKNTLRIISVESFLKKHPDLAGEKINVFENGDILVHGNHTRPAVVYEMFTYYNK